MKEYFENLLRLMIDKKASDLHIKANSHPILRISDSLTFLDDMPRHTAEQVEEIAYSILPSEKWEHFQKENEMDKAYSLASVGRFRLNMFVQRGSVVIVARAISLNVPQFDDLNMPAMVRNLANKTRGLVLITGTTGSGKSTTLASLIGHINKTRSANIITIEDPIEYLHHDNLSVVNQREIGLDTKDFSTALRYLLRQDPDVILIGEIRDASTMEVALSAADTGHLVFSTLHTTDARQTIERVVSFFPLDQSDHIRLNLALNLAGIVSQRLLPRKNAKGLIPAVEIMVNTERIRKAISENKIYEITQYISEGEVYGMQTFNQSLYKLVKEDHIEQEVALAASSSPDELRMLLKGIFPNTADSMSTKEITSTLLQQKKTQHIFQQKFIEYPEEKHKEPEFIDYPEEERKKNQPTGSAHKKLQKFISYPEPEEMDSPLQQIGIVANLRKELQSKKKIGKKQTPEQKTTKKRILLILFLLFLIFFSFIPCFSCPRCSDTFAPGCSHCKEGKVPFWKWLENLRQR